MSNGFLFWYERGWPPQHAADRVLSLEAAGFSLGHFTTGRITEISGDADSAGERVAIDRATLLRRAAVAQAKSFSFKYWIGLDIDVFCTVERLDADLVVQRLYLDGASYDGIPFVVRVVFGQVRDAPASTVGVVVDRRGNSENEDWDAIVAGSPERVAVRADIMGFRDPVAAAHPELRHEPAARIGDLVVYDPHGVLASSLASDWSPPSPAAGRGV